MIDAAELKRLVNRHAMYGVPASERALSDFLLSHASELLALVEADQWRPIESAPRDGTQIIGFRWPCEDNRKAWPHMCSIAHWDGYNWHWMNGHYLSPTHWRPLPKEPAQ